MTIDYTRAVRRARALWTRHDGPWALDAAGKPVLKALGGFTDVHAPEAATFNRDGAIIKAIEEQTGPGQCTGRQYATVAARLRKSAAAALGHKGGSVTSDAKAAAARANGARGGRPKKTATA